MTQNYESMNASDNQNFASFAVYYQLYGNSLKGAFYQAHKTILS
jgi:hypothetical protein